MLVYLIVKYDPELSRTNLRVKIVCTGTKNMHVIRVLGYYKTDDLRNAAFLCGCIPIGCVPANSR